MSTAFPDPEQLVQITDAERVKVEQAVAARDEFEKLVNGGVVRAAAFDRTVLPHLGFATAGLMLTEILTGRIEIRTAKEAADVAKLALEIARREAGEPDANAGIQTPEQRQVMLKNIEAMRHELGERAKQAAAGAGDDDLVPHDQPLPAVLSIVHSDADTGDPED